MDQIGEILSDIDGIFSYATMVIRFLLPALAVIIIARCIRSLLREKSEPENWGFLVLPNGARIYLRHWENIIGRAKSCDVCVEYPTISRSHAALMRDDKGNWRIYDVESKSGVTVNGRVVDPHDKAHVNSGDTLGLGGVEFGFVSIDRASEYEQAAARTRPGRMYKQRTTLVFLTEFQILLGLQLCISKGGDLTPTLPICMLILIMIMWACYLVTRVMRRVSFEIETLAFFLCTIGMSVTATISQTDMLKQLALLLIGVIFFFALGGFLRDLDRINRLRMPIAALGLLLLAVNIVFARTVYGARNWIEIAGVSFQPSELVKITFIFAGAATLDRLLAKRNLLSFIGFAAICVIALALINDFGTAMVFFVAYLVIAFMRSGDIGTIFLSVAGAGLAGFLALQMRAHIAGRFSTWGRVWEFASSRGYQQTRALAAAAGGGLFGVGAGNGWLKGVFAADTDIVFGMVCEELGLIVAVTAIVAILAFAVFSVWTAGEARSSFYVIGACAASAILVFQMTLNVLGTVDILPFTGITFPFVSKGGSSLISCWALLAFIKAADTRQNASFVIKMPKRITEKYRSDTDSDFTEPDAFESDFTEPDYGAVYGNEADGSKRHSSEPYGNIELEYTDDQG